MNNHVPPNNGRKRVILRLTRREQSDPKSILDATREALKDQCGLTLELRTLSDAVEYPVYPMAQEQLETAVRVEVDVTLRVVAEHEAAKPAEEKKSDPVTWWSRIKDWGKFLIAETVRAVIGESVKKVGGG